jgi:hypothetical protein
MKAVVSSQLPNWQGLVRASGRLIIAQDEVLGGSLQCRLSPSVSEDCHTERSEVSLPDPEIYWCEIVELPLQLGQQLPQRPLDSIHATLNRFQLLPVGSRI